MKPQVPADISTLSVDELEALSADIVTYAQATLGNAEASAEDKAEARALVAERTKIKALAASKRADAAQAQADADLLAELSNDEGDADEADGDADTTDDGDEDAEAEAEAAGKVLVTAGSAPAKAKKAAATVADPPVPSGFGGSGSDTPKLPAERLAPQYLTAARGVDGKSAGETFDSWLELAEAAVSKAGTIDAATTDRYKLASIKARYPKDRVLGEDMFANLQKFENTAELTAAFCAPATPYYNLACMNTVRRPVFNSLPGFQAPRGRVSIMSSPSLSDIDSGYGQWEDTDDDDANARKTCSTVECGSPTTFKIYGVWRCLTVKNLMAMTYPELVEAWLNRLQAAHSRLAEQLLLDAMGTRATELNAQRLGYGASVSITSTILNYITLYQETQRWDVTDNLEGWAHRYVLNGIKIDLMRRRRTDGQLSVPSTEQVNAMFREVGVDMHWFIDTPTWGEPIASVGSSNLNLIPQAVQILLAPKGKFALMDRGELSIGVTGNHIYRDNTSNERNQFTIFYENFEGVVDTTSCPAHILDIPVCWNGAQIDDIVINCQGGDEAGYQS